MLVRTDDFFLAMLRFEPGGTIHEHPGPQDTFVACIDGAGWTSVAGRAGADPRGTSGALAEGRPASPVDE